MTDEKQLTPEQVRTQLRQYAREKGLDPALADSALSDDNHIPDDLMNLLTEIAGHLIEAAPK